MSKYYAGIGSRETPLHVQQKMTDIASLLEARGYILRSGGADGADKAFEAGVKNDNNKEIYLPWKKFNGSASQLFKQTEYAKEIAARIHPVWNQLSFGAKALHARNVQQVLGMEESSPISLFVICWTLGGGVRGGTATAMKVAVEQESPVYNLADEQYANLTAEQIVEIVDKD